MNVDEIKSLVAKVSDTFDFGKYETNLLIRYYVHKHCAWLTQVAIAHHFGISKHNVHKGLKTVENDSRYAIMKLRINHEINKVIHQR